VPLTRTSEEEQGDTETGVRRIVSVVIYWVVLTDSSTWLSRTSSVTTS
jgi:hypothetical protein